MGLALSTNNKECSAAECRYFTLMSIFSSLTGMLLLLSMYLYLKVRAYIKKKQGLEKETRVLQQGQTSFAAACVGGRRRTDIMFQREPRASPSVFSKVKCKGKGQEHAKKEYMETEATLPTTSYLRPGMPGYPYPKLDLGEEETEAE